MVDMDEDPITVDELRRLRQQTENQITDILAEFRRATGAYFKHIEIHNQHVANRRRVFNQTITTEIEIEK